MMQFAKLLHKCVGAAAVAVVLAGCGRSEYAMLPKTSAYHGEPVSQNAPKPAATDAPSLAAAAEMPAVAPAAATEPAALTAAKPTAATTPTTAPATAAAAPKAAPTHSLLARKVTKKLNKLVATTQLRKHHEAASANQAHAGRDNLRLGIIFLAIGLILALFSGVNGIFAVLGTIAVIIGIVLLVLWLLDQV